jgi:hypothetical protein
MARTTRRELRELRLQRQGRARTKRQLVAATTAGMLLLGSMALADDLDATGDDLVGGEIDFGEICIGDAALSTTLTLRAKRSSNNDSNWWANSALLAVSSGDIVGTGLSVGLTPTPATIQLPSDWTSLPTSGASQGVSTGSVSALITLNPGVLTAADFDSNGDYEGSVEIQAVGDKHDSTTPGTLRRGAEIDVVAQLGDCGTSSTYSIDGFYQPVDNALVNGAKAGRVIPLKFNILNADLEKQDDTSLVTAFVQKTTCLTGEYVDNLLLSDTLASGNTELRWDADGEQMIFNWKTPKTKGCYTIQLDVAGDMLSVNFQLS